MRSEYSSKKLLNDQIDRLLACYNLIKNSIFQNPSMDRETPPVPFVIQNLEPEFQSEGRHYFSNRTHFWPLDILWGVLAFWYQDMPHNFYSIFYGI